MQDLSFRLLLFAAGLLAFLLWPMPPGLPAWVYRSMALLLLVAVTLTSGRRWLAAVALFAAGAAWTLGAVAEASGALLPDQLNRCRWQVQGRVVGLPRMLPRLQRFDFKVRQGSWVECPYQKRLIPPNWQVTGKKLRLSLYHSAQSSQYPPAPDERRPVLAAGDQITALVQLRPPSSSANPGGFDSEAYFVRARLAANGYVRTLEAVEPRPGSLDGWRQQVSHWLVHLPDISQGRWLAALLIGDQRGLTQADWDVLRRTGTVHLLVVSGLHISLAAGFGWLLGWLLAAVTGGRRYHLGALFALLSAGGYALATGLGIPAQRALIMVAIFVGTSLLHRHVPLHQRYLYTLIAVLVSAPLAPLGVGFWLSFAAVLMLLLAFRPTQGDGRPQWAMSLLRAQLALTMMLTPLLIQIQHQIHWLTPLINLLAVPLLSFALLPASLLAAPLDGLLAYLGFGVPFFLHLPDRLLVVLRSGLEAAAALEASWSLRSGWALFAPLVAPLVWLPMPRLIRASALMLWVLLVFAGKPETRVDFRLLVLDVGQGLSVVIQTGDQAVVYDTGPAYASGSDSAQRIILPALQHYGVRQITTLVISHGDYDHAGGTASLVAAMPPDRIIAGQPRRLPASIQAEPCHFDAWQQGPVHFTIRPAPIQHVRANTYSCVMVATYRGQQIVFPGDLPARGELSLLPALSKTPTAVLIASHHGSRDASHPDFLRALRPDFVIYAAGYHNRYGHPAKASCRHARQIGAKLYNTAYQGAIEMRPNAADKLKVHGLHRCNARRWWQRYHPLACRSGLGYQGECPYEAWNNSPIN